MSVPAAKIVWRLKFDVDLCLIRKTKDIVETPEIKGDPATFVITENEALVASIVNEIAALPAAKRPTKIVVSSLSNRESYASDKANKEKLDYWCVSGNKKRRCISSFDALERIRLELETRLLALNIHIPVVLNKLLLADIYGNLPPGTSWDNACLQYAQDARPTADAKDIAHASCIHDHTKFTIVYPEAHLAVFEDPDAKIDLRLYEDEPRYLESLFQLFQDGISRNSVLLPKNVTLSFNRYSVDGFEKDFCLPLNGIGEPDQYYARRIVIMGKLWMERDNNSGVEQIYARNVKVGADDQFRLPIEELETLVKSQATSASAALTVAKLTVPPSHSASITSPAKLLAQNPSFPPSTNGTGPRPDDPRTPLLKAANGTDSNNASTADTHSAKKSWWSCFPCC